MYFRALEGNSCNKRYVTIYCAHKSTTVIILVRWVHHWPPSLRQSIGFIFDHTMTIGKTALLAGKCRLYDSCIVIICTLF